jgi:hypothetical protein
MRRRADSVPRRASPNYSRMTLFRYSPFPLRTLTHKSKAFGPTFMPRIGSLPSSFISKEQQSINAPTTLPTPGMIERLFFMLHRTQGFPINAHPIVITGLAFATIALAEAIGRKERQERQAIGLFEASRNIYSSSRLGVFIFICVQGSRSRRQRCGLGIIIRSWRRQRQRETSWIIIYGEEEKGEDEEDECVYILLSLASRFLIVGQVYFLTLGDHRFLSSMPVVVIHDDL